MKLSSLHITFLISILFLQPRMLASDIELRATEMLQRVAPQLIGKVAFRHIESAVDTFAVTSLNDTVMIKGSSVGAVCVALNNYLRNYLKVNVSWFSDMPVEIPEEIVIPDPDYPLTGQAVVNNRFFLNYCTFGYTTPFWDWNEWERFIDWMALNGINMPLAMTGQEKVWLETWIKMGMTTNEVLQSFTGPAHLPWHWMGNIDSFMGPLTKNWIDQNEKLQKKILKRERELGMTPVLPAFSGHVPAKLKELYPHADITPRQKWGEFDNAHNSFFLNPADSVFPIIQNVFLTTYDSIYGTNHIYSVDPFNEIDAPDWSETFLRRTASSIFNSLVKADPEAKWLQMSWTFYNDPYNWTLPRVKAFLESVPDDRLILLDYYVDAQPVWEITEEYFGKPFILCYLGNFGGNTAIAGNIYDIDNKINKFLETENFSRYGMGGTAEGLDVNSFIHEFFLAKVWNPQLTPQEWARLWADTRGAENNSTVYEAWKLLSDFVYVEQAKVGQGALTNHRPSLTDTVTGYADANFSYDNDTLLHVLDLLLDAEECLTLPAYRSDVVNITRQLLGNEFMLQRQILNKVYLNNNLDSVKIIANTMLEILADLDRLMATDGAFSLYRWIEGARNKGATPQEKDDLERNARTLLTQWGYPDTRLNDYANRHWSGLISGFYLPRWTIFINALIRSMESGDDFSNDSVKNQIIQFENNWISSIHPLPAVPSDENPVALARDLRKKYFANRDNSFNSSFKH